MPRRTRDMSDEQFVAVLKCYGVPRATGSGSTNLLRRTTASMARGCRAARLPRTTRYRVAHHRKRFAGIGAG
jgi:hypothetical protein